MTIKGLHHVQLAAPAGSEPALRAFYAGVLGLREVPKPAELARRGGVWFRGEGMEVHLGVEEEFRPARKAHPAFLVDDLDAYAKKIPGAQEDTLFPGYRRIYVSDPVGNRIELLQPV
ncbi:glyoxalase [Nonomuraea rubra]|uniref:Catechol 2,3-dioxygenase-like lactoylglutathione lyase family enzyme n=1 Tax=Nonomuraea rubra TaxID=46180 RepID=A0A7X0NM70_9ACTN|nr:glyoxalase [Nonomuraea rubra]MBB6545975.1 catechol 2,3-dioxygenase-like lactoylglutathione lyase family enzyme [Nonomuraea rubra]